MIKLKGLIDEDFTQYKLPSMFIIFPYCTFKCDHDCGSTICQNSALATAPLIEVDEVKLVQRYLNNKITSAITYGGLEPFDTFDDLVKLTAEFRKYTSDPIIIYTGYYKEELTEKLSEIKEFSNIIIKFGRFIPGQKSHVDEVLGISLASANQYAERIS